LPRKPHAPPSLSLKYQNPDAAGTLTSNSTGEGAIETIWARKSDSEQHKPTISGNLSPRALLFPVTAHRSRHKALSSLLSPRKHELCP